MDSVVGIAAKSLDAAHQLAKAIHGPREWSYQKWVGLNGEGVASAQAGPAVPAHALLLLSHDYSTAYLLLATHATTAELLSAAKQAAGTASASPSSSPAASASAAAPAPAAGLRRDSSGDDNPTQANAALPAGATGLQAAPTAAPPPPQLLQLPPLQALQQRHEVAVSVLLLQLFLVCDVVLVLLPTAGGAGGGGGGGAGASPLAGAVEWLSRLRLLQGARRALHQGVYGRGGSGAVSPSSAPAAAAACRAASEAKTSHQQQLEHHQQLLRDWCSRRSPPALYFVSPSDTAAPPEETLAAPPPNPSTSSPMGRRGAAAAHVAGSCQPAAGVNGIMRSLFKRCRPLPASAYSSTAADPRVGSTDPWVLCTVDLQQLVMQPGPVSLSPAEVHDVVLAALLDPDQEDVVQSASAVMAGSLGATDGLQCLRETVAAAAAATAAGNGGLNSVRGHAGRAVQAGAGMISSPPHHATAVLALQGFSSSWQCTAEVLYGAAVAAWWDAVRRPLDWSPPLGPFSTTGRRSASPSAATATTRGRSSRPGAATAATMQDLPSTSGLTSPYSSSSASPSSGDLDPAAAWLASAAAASGGGLVVRLASELADAAADAVLRQYLSTTPPRYPARAHSAAVAATLAALAAAAPPGPAAATAAARLRAACDAAWRAGRRQCSALSVTGRPCCLPADHDPLEEPHRSETTSWCTTTTTGSSWVLVPDPFDVQVANCAAVLDDGDAVGVPPPPPQSGSSTSTLPSATTASGSGRQKGGRKGSGSGAAAVTPTSDLPKQHPQQPQQQPLLAAAAGAAHSRHLVIAAAQIADGTTRQCALGPWVTITRLGPASAYNERRGLSNQPGLNGSHLFPLMLHLEGSGVGGTTAGTAAGSVSKSAGGRGGKAAAAAAQGGGGGKGDGGDGVVLLDEQSFPSLAAAAAQTAPPAAAMVTGQGPRRGAAAAAKKGSAEAQTGGKGSAAAGGGDELVAAVSRERAALAKAWPNLYGSGVRASAGAASNGGSAAPGLGGSTTAAAAAAAAAAVTSRGRRARGAAAAGGGAEVVAGVDATVAFPSLAGARDTRKVYVSYEYQTLDGRRFLATPQQLAAALASTTPPEAAAAAPPPPASPSPSAPQQQRSIRPPRTEIAAAVASAAAGSGSGKSGGGGGASNSAASFLLQHDAPLFLQPPQGLQPETGPPKPTHHDGAPAWDPTPRRPAGLAQLRRIFVVTPPSAYGEPLLAVRPTIQVRVEQPPSMPADAAEAAGLSVAPLRQRRRQADAEVGGGGGGGQQVAAAAEDVEVGLGELGRASELVSRPEAPAVVVHMSLVRPVPLPPDSQVVVCLPAAYGLPAEWLGWGGCENSSCGGGDGKAKDMNGSNGSAGGDGGDEAPVAGVSMGTDGQGQVSKEIAQAGPGQPQQQTGVSGKDAASGGGGSSSASGAAGGGGNVGGGGGTVRRQLPQGRLLPLVQLDERMPFDARLVAGSALFPIIPAAAAAQAAAAD